jgi:geranylgeranyl pyrophosphate synthase
MQPMLAWQFQTGSKYFRPVTIFSCYRAIYAGRIPPELIRSAAALEMLHNMSLVIDDIVDHSAQRRGINTLHREFDELRALMTAGVIVADAYDLVRHDPHDVELFSELLRRLGVAECDQWQRRRTPGGFLGWLSIAKEDTGSMFEICARLGTRTRELQAFGGLLGTLYHGCDDVGDVRGASALGGGGAEDLRDGILTLPAALATTDARIATLFTRSDLADAELEVLAEACRASLPEAEAYLDEIADAARQEARDVSAHPDSLLRLIDHTRALSNQ